MEAFTPALHNLLLFLFFLAIKNNSVNKASKENFYFCLVMLALKNLVASQILRGLSLVPQMKGIPLSHIPGSRAGPPEPSKQMNFMPKRVPTCFY
jgi:hypothetical protein